MTFGIDARLYGLEHAGIGRYVMNLVDRLPERLNCKLTLFIHPRHAAYFIPNDRLSIVMTPIRHYSLAEQTGFLQLVNREKLSLFHVPHFNVPLLYRGPFVVTIHDILWHQIRGGSVTTLPPWLYHLKYYGYRKTVNHTVKDAKAIFVPSVYVKHDVLHEYPVIDPDKITVTYEGITSDSLVNTKVAIEPLTGRDTPYLLYIGSAYPHKNIPVIFKTMAIMAKEQPQLKLVVVSSRTVFLEKLMREAETHHVDDRIVFAGFRDDATIQSLFHNAVALVHPSKSEGFGLTGLEAMKAGCPVIAANATCLPEVYGDAAMFFDPDSPEALREAIRTIMTDRAIRQIMIAKGLEQVKKYSWDKMADQTVAIYKKILNIRG